MDLNRWVATPRTLVLCCDPRGRLWETSLRLRDAQHVPVGRPCHQRGAPLRRDPDQVEAGFLCLDPATTMRTFRRGQEQGRRLLASDRIRRFLSG